MSVKERIKEFAKHRALSIREFERLSNLNYGYVNAIRVSIQPDKIKTISAAFPELNTNWLLTGKGEMLNDNAPKVGECFTPDSVIESMAQLVKNNTLLVETNQKLVDKILELTRKI